MALSLFNYSRVVKNIVFGLPHSLSIDDGKPVTGVYGPDSINDSSGTWHEGYIHAGLDIGDYRPGESVYNPADGDVIGSYRHSTREYGKSLGSSVVVDHGIQPDGHRYVSSFNHLSGRRPLARAGTRVLAGDYIGTIADIDESGNGVPPHLHWQVAWDAEGFDPTLHVMRRYNASAGQALIDPLSLITKTPSELDLRDLREKEFEERGQVNFTRAVNPQGPSESIGFGEGNPAARLDRQFLLEVDAFSENRYLSSLKITQAMRVNFDIQYSPNEEKLGRITIYNLSDASASVLRLAEQKFYRLHAGYGFPGIIALGEVRLVREEWEYPDRKTTLITVNGTQEDIAATVTLNMHQAEVWKIIDRVALSKGLQLGPITHLPDLRTVVNIEQGTFPADAILEQYAGRFNFETISHMGILYLFRPGIAEPGGYLYYRYP